MSVTYLPLEIWNKHWSVEGHQVRCRCCRATQSFTDLSPFNHVLGCKAQALDAEYPCYELTVILEEKTKIEAGLF